MINGRGGWETFGRRCVRGRETRAQQDCVGDCVDRENCAGDHGAIGETEQFLGMAYAGVL
jgi:hypothetical protein